MVNVLPFREMEVESSIPFQELGANFTFCCMAINREGNASDMLHSFTITSKILTGSLAEWGRMWGLFEDPSFYTYIPVVFHERWNRFHKPPVLPGAGRLWHLSVLGAMWELLAGQRLSHAMNTL